MAQGGGLDMSELKNRLRALLGAAGATLVLVSTAYAVPVEFEWVQNSCTGNACGATVEGIWSFKEEAVQRGTATYFTLRDIYPDYAPDGVEAFSFTLGAFVLQGHTFGPLTWTNSSATDGAGRLGRGGIYEVTFAADRQSISAIVQRATPDWPFGSPDSTTFELAPTNPTMHITVWPDKIEYYQYTGSEPRGPDGIPIIPGLTTFTGDWRAVDVPTPIPTPASLALVGLSVTAASLRTRRARRARR